MTFLIHVTLTIYFFLNVFTYSPWGTSFIIVCWCEIFHLTMIASFKLAKITHFKFIASLKDIWIPVCITLISVFYLISAIIYIVTISGEAEDKAVGKSSFLWTFVSTGVALHVGLPSILFLSWQGARFLHRF